ncbi:MAG TPA: hypothetical protein VMP03_04350, partial [Methylomirabilota bacterium]|nr:hypothetical protein [Methylomirabilota bacterium]
MSWSIAFDPLVPWWLIAAGAAVALLVVAAGSLRRVKGALVRGLAFLALLAALADPSLVEEQRNPLESVVAVVADRSPSQDIGTRANDTTAAVDTLVARLQRLPDVEVRRVETGAGGTRDGTQIFADVSRALADVPPDRIGAIITITDGVVHDAPADVAALGFDAPVHGLITGSADEFDRRIAIVSAPKFGLVGSTQPLRFRVDDQGAAGDRGAADVVIRRDGEEILRMPAPPGEEIPVDLEITHGGSNIFEI